MTQKLTNSILKKWREQGSFIRFLDGNTLNCSVNNLAWVSIKDAMLNFDSWRTDWDADLSKREKDLVNDPTWRSGLSFR